MTIPIILFALVLVMAVGLALELLCLSRATPKLEEGSALANQAPDPKRFQVIGRLLRRDDGSAVRGRFAKARRKLLRRHLRSTKNDFLRTWSLCRLLAPYIQDPDFGDLIFRELFSFYGLYASLWVRHLSHNRISPRLDALELLALMDRISDAAQSALGDAQDVALAAFDS